MIVRQFQQTQESLKRVVYFIIQLRFVLVGLVDGLKGCCSCRCFTVCNIQDTISWKIFPFLSRKNQKLSGKL